MDVDFELFWSAVAEVGVYRDGMQELIDFYEKSVMSGLINYPDIFNREFSNLRLSDIDFINKAWCKIIKPNDQMVNFVQCLKHEGFKIAFLSNIGATHLKTLRAHGRLMDLADVQHMSCEVGVIKPSLLYFQSFLMQHDDFAGCMYLDDRPENIVAASKCKFDSIKFELDSFKSKPPSVLKKELNKIRDRLLRGC